MARSKHLFIDDQIIEEVTGVTQKLNQPAKYVGNPVMIPLYPWEGRVELYGTVWRDNDGEFRMWYTGLGGMGIPAIGTDQSQLRYKNFDNSTLLYTIGYATSSDGVFWDRPNLGIVDYEGSKNNNLVLLDAASANIIKDVRDPDPNRLYKALFYESADFAGTPNMGVGVSVAFSSDGLRWHKYSENPVITRASDSHMLLGWDDLHNAYVAYCRPSVHEGDKTRRIGRCVSDNFVEWSDPEDVLVPDKHDPPGLEFYAMPVFKYEDLYIGQLYAYHTPPEEPQIRFAGTVDVQLAVSRDGIEWQRVGDRQPFIPTGPPGSIDAGEIYVARSPVVVDDELWFYYSPGASEHGITGRSGPICLAKLRLDGFVSVDAGDEIGTLITKPFRCDGGHLDINASARGGLVSVSVLDETGIQHDGFSRQDCAPFDGDSVKHTITWREKGSLDELRGRDIRLKFYLRSTKLYSFTIGETLKSVVK